MIQLRDYNLFQFFSLILLDLILFNFNFNIKIFPNT